MSVDSAEIVGGGDTARDEQEAVSPPPTASRQVAIVGFAEGHRHEAPTVESGWDVWGMNRLHAVMPDRQWSRWYDLHSLERFYTAQTEQGLERDEEHIGFLQRFPGPVYVRPEDVPIARAWDIPNATPFPYVDLVRVFGTYFTNTVSWLIAHALFEGLGEGDTLGVWGVDMAQDTLANAEYSSQRPSCEYFLGIAAQAGVNVMLPAGSDLLQSTHLYGWEQNSFLYDKSVMRAGELGARKETFKTQLAQLEAQKRVNEEQFQQERLRLVAAINQIDGAMQEQVYLRQHIPPRELPDPPHRS